jgi:hypothetical protein
MREDEDRGRGREWELEEGRVTGGEEGGTGRKEEGMGRRKDERGRKLEREEWGGEGGREVMG